MRGGTPLARGRLARAVRTHGVLILDPQPGTRNQEPKKRKVSRLRVNTPLARGRLARAEPAAPPLAPGLAGSARAAWGGGVGGWGWLCIYYIYTRYIYSYDV